MANIRDVAEKAGCSIATVSRVLSGDSSFSVRPETREKIFAAVSELGYTIPVRERDRKKIGCVMAITAEKYSDPFFTDILTGIEKECENQGLSIASVRSYNELSSASIFQEFINSDLAGVILMERIPDMLLEQITKYIPHVIFIDNDEDNYLYDGVGFDHRLANRQAMTCLLEHGYRRIALISGSSPNEPLLDSIRLSTYRDTLRKAGLDYDPRLVRDCMWDLDRCAEQAKTLMQLEDPPDAIFAGSDSLASAILSALYSIGIKCPDDVGIIGFNNIELCNYTIPPLTTVEIPKAGIGTVAVQRLKEMMDNPGGERRKILLPTRVIERESLKKGE